MKIYTKTGDRGSTSLVGGERVGKDDLRVEAYGSVDELSAMIAFLRDNIDEGEIELDEYREDILTILNTLMNLEALLASGAIDSKIIPDVSDVDIAYLENRIDYINEQLKPIDKFTIPGGHPLVSLSHVCRTICRRAERSTVKASRAFEISDNTIKYLNRLSDYLYQLARRFSDYFNIKETYWVTDN